MGLAMNEGIALQVGMMSGTAFGLAQQKRTLYEAMQSRKPVTKCAPSKLSRLHRLTTRAVEILWQAQWFAQKLPAACAKQQAFPAAASAYPGQHLQAAVP